MSRTGDTQEPSPEVSGAGIFKGVGYAVDEEIYQANLPPEKLVVDPRLRSPNYRAYQRPPDHVSKEVPVWETTKGKIAIITSPMVTVNVGSEAKLFLVHKGILEQGPFFAACLLANRFQEGVDNTINLPEDDPAAMAFLFRFLYTGRLFDKDVDEADSDCPYWIKTTSCLIAMWIIADKYHIQWLRHEMVDVYLARLDTSDVNESHFEEMKEAGLYDTALWDLLADALLPRAARGLWRSLGAAPSSSSSS